MSKRWVAFFSQTGSEIADLSEKIGKWPYRIITNKRPDHLRTIDPRIVERGYKEVSNKPTVAEYLSHLVMYEADLVTLHGWLRIVPEGICDNFEIYNGHPGLITKYPDLKGKDPQQKAYINDYREIGSVIHKVTAGVDEGDIVLEESKKLFNKLDIDDYFTILKDTSLTSWVRFFEKVL